MFFLWCHIRHINPVELHPKRITKADNKLVRYITNPEKIIQDNKEPVSNHNYNGIEFPVREKDFSKI